MKNTEPILYLMEKLLQTTSLKIKAGKDLFNMKVSKRHFRREIRGHEVCNKH